MIWQILCGVLRPTPAKFVVTHFGEADDLAYRLKLFPSYLTKTIFKSYSVLLLVCVCVCFLFFCFCFFFLKKL